MLKVAPWQRPSSAPAPPQDAPGGPVQLGTPRARPRPLGPQPQRLSCSSEPPPKPPVSPPLTVRLLVRVKDRNPAPMANLELLFEGTYAQLMTLAQQAQSECIYIHITCTCMCHIAVICIDDSTAHYLSSSSKYSTVHERYIFI